MIFFIEYKNNNKLLSKEFKSRFSNMSRACFDGWLLDAIKRGRVWVIYIKGINQNKFTQMENELESFYKNLDFNGVIYGYYDVNKNVNGFKLAIISDRSVNNLEIPSSLLCYPKLIKYKIDHQNDFDKNQLRKILYEIHPSSNQKIFHKYV